MAEMAESGTDIKEVSKKIASDIRLFQLRVSITDVWKPWRCQLHEKKLY